MIRSRHFFAALACLALSACDGADGPCTDTAVTILAPLDGETFTEADDVDPDDPGTQIEFVIEASCLAEDELVELHMLEPAESLYGGGAPDAMGIFRGTYPLIPVPTPNRFVARTSIAGVESEEVAVTVSF